jgi:hypothetical protein
MGQMRLSGLAIISIERDRAIKPDASVVEILLKVKLEGRILTNNMISSSLCQKHEFSIIHGTFVILAKG